ncbi:2-oxoacid:acceptor oxidoreductase, alpha subunit [Gemmatirosa kalamazoonensis]|uniref:2-oxoacid:acceptor oxidoreductase, alpha subunit n=1 Tax=Gemmatirosa kalamazoonensis TaxID=861299 RepID=W0RF08_9BACT|nr:2-oxoacid:acceptor oxidoreductase subunit alpha [Gemmatirosa kalamazoonensis]AHG89027.1 2-oxoacid:acceptor oxidoreductase, alpha subunit [Gemmatirosa kalamazoonensis]
MSGINDFAFRIGTVNGTGSASANGLLMQAIFRMGIPVSGKNLFPSNIQGLPTWYEIRVSGDGWIARPSDVDLVVALNPATYAKDVAAVRTGGYLLYDSSWPLDAALARDDVHVLGVPFGALCTEAFTGDRERTLLRNIAYAGALSALLDIDTAVLDALVKERYGKKPKLLDANAKALALGAEYARTQYGCPLPFHLEPMDATRDHVLLDGNTAAGLGALYAGATVGAWYPITPSTSLMEAFTEFCARWRVDPATKQKRYCILQAEDELSAAGMVVGAGWAGARAFTCTAGPGISLMQEFIGLAYYAEIPGVFFDVQRAGPSTGMPTRTQQADLFSLAYASHGDTKHIVLFPASPEECFTMAAAAFDLAERYQTPVFVASDLDIGMNDWMCRRFTWDDAYRPDRGKVLGKAELDRIAKFARYRDVDGDGIAARTLPGVDPRGAYFTRGSGHDANAAYTEDSAEYREVVDRLARKIAGAADTAPQPVIDAVPNGSDGEPAVGVVSLGGCDGAVREATATLRALGVAVDYLRVRAFPFAASVREFLESHPRLFVVEQNRDAQLRSLLAIETGVARDRMTAVLDYGGLPLTARVVVDAVLSGLGTRDSGLGSPLAASPESRVPSPAPRVPTVV